jgi:YgiT-type zinc finger domain-containing protein
MEWEDRMWSAEVEGRWRALSEEVITGMAAWRAQHPRATLAQIEVVLDERLAGVRARMLQDVALATAAADLSAAPATERPRCPECGHALEAHGVEERTLRTTHERTVTLRRSYARCPACGVGLFPPG